MDKKLQKRLEWVTRCASVQSFYIRMFNDWRSKTWKVFIEALKVYVYTEHPTGWWMETKELEPHSCYYLGRYPWYWDFNYFGAVSPLWGQASPPLTKKIQDLLASPHFHPGSTWVYSPPFKQSGVWVGGSGWVVKRNIQPFPMAPFYSGLEYDLYKDRDEEENRYFLGDTIIDTWNEQQAWIKAMDQRFKDCLAKNYPREEKVKQRIIKTPEGPAEWPGKPIQELTLPKPVPRGIMPPGTKLNLSFTLEISPPGKPEGLTSTISMSPV